MTGADPPKMQVGDAVVTELQALAQIIHELVIGDDIQKHRAGGLYETQRPCRNHASANDGHQRVHPDPTIEPPGQQGDDCQHGGQGIGEHMQIGAVQIVVTMMVIMMPRTVAMIVMVVMIVPQQPGADQIDAETESGDGDRLIEADRQGAQEAHHGLIADQQGDESQKDGARISRQFADLTGPEGKAWIRGVTACEAIGDRRDGAPA